MRFALYFAQQTTSYLRYLDGEYTLIHTGLTAKAECPSDMWAVLSTAKGDPCDQNWAKTVKKQCLYPTRTVGAVLYGIPDDVDLYTGVYRRRTELRMTQAHLAEASGIDSRKIRKLEHGDIAICNLTAKTLFAISDALQIDPRELENY